jgi:hypothetical protein
MFTDQPVTPTRVETLLNLMREFSDRKFTREILLDLLQPDGLPGNNPEKKHAQAKQAISTATELGLIEEDAEKRLKLTFKSGDKRNSKEILLEALDEKVLSDTQVEPYFSLFYSYILSLNFDGTKTQTGDSWVLDFQQHVYGQERPPNPFNDTKLTGLHRWYGYIGLGWYDPNKVFQANPYNRLLRRLPFIFKKDKKLTGEIFMQKLAELCPELDGGVTFLKTHRLQEYDASAKTCTLGLSQALIDLHQDKIIRLVCPHDSRGWSIELAEPPSGEGLDSNRIDSIELLKN